MKTNPADKLRKLADGMTAKIDELSRCSDQRPTPRRMRMEDARLQKRDGLRNAQAILYRLAEYWESGEVPAVLSGVKTKKDAEILDYAINRDTYGRAFGSYQAEFAKMGITTADELAQAKQLLAANAAPVDDTANQIRRLEYQIMGNKSTEFFPTPLPIVDMMLAELETLDISGGRLLEPSAGNGRLADAARNAGYYVECVEVNGILRQILELKAHKLVGWDFANFEDSDGYDVVLMNPPFSEETDHIRRAFDLLKPNGLLVAVASPKLKFRTTKKYTDFAAFVDQYGGFVDLPDNVFAKELNSTGVSTVLITLTKP